MSKMSDFQKQFLSAAPGMEVYTKKEFEAHLAIAKAEIMQVAIDTTKTAIAIERNECAKVCEAMAGLGIELDIAMKFADAIRNRMKK